MVAVYRPLDAGNSLPYIPWLYTKNQAEVTEAAASMTAQIQADYEGKVVFPLCGDRGKEFVNKTLHHYALQVCGVPPQKDLTLEPTA